jgi:hypothetical protein
VTYRTTGSRTTSLRRSWPTTRRALALAAILAGGAALLELFVVTSLVGHALSIFILALAALFVRVAVGAGVADCPSCGERLSLSLGRRDPAILCPCCHVFIESDGRTLGETPEGTQATFPAFGAVLRGDPVFPDRCCVCGEASTRRLPVRATVDGPSYEVPHCDAHERGASLRKNETSFILRFRSLAYLKSFLAQNGLEARGSNTVLAKPGAAPKPAGPMKEDRWLSLAAALFLWGLAALCYAFISDDGIIEFGGHRATNLIILLTYKLLGKKLVAAAEIGLGAIFFLAFSSSFGKAPQPDEAEPKG